MKKHTFRPLSLLSLFLLGCFIQGVVAAEPALTTQANFSRFSLEQGLSDTSVMAILQDHQGFMWFGTQKGGLNRYDGYEFRVYKKDHQDETSLSHNFIWSMLEDSHNNLWIGTNGGGLNRYDRASDRFIRYPVGASGIPHFNIKTIAEDADGTLWVGGSSSNGFGKLDRDSGEFTGYHSPDDDGIRDIVQDRQTGLLWLGTYDNGVLVFDANRERFVANYRFEAANPSTLNTVQAIHQTRNGELWVATYNGLQRFNRDSRSFTRYYHDADVAGSLSDNRVEGILEDSRGRLWISTHNGLNLYHPDSDTFTHLNDSRIRIGFSGPLLEDASGAFWVGGQGVQRLAAEPAKFTRHGTSPDDPDGLRGSPIETLFADKQGGLWVGTPQGLHHFDDGGFTSFVHDPDDPASISHNSVSSITAAPQGGLWVGTSGGLNYFDGQAFTRYQPDPADTDSIAGQFIRDVVVDADGGLWIALYAIGMDYFDGKRFVHFQPGAEDAGGIMSRWPYQIIRDVHNHRLWIATFGDIMQLDPQNRSFTHIFPTPELKDKIVPNQTITLYQNKNGLLWIGGGDSGLLLFNPATRKVIRHYTQNDGLADNHVTAIVADEAGDLWLTTQNGLSRFNPENETFQNYYVAHGLHSNKLTSAARTMDGHIYIGSQRGLSSFHPEQLMDNPYSPPVVLTGFELFNQPVEIGAQGSPLSQAINVSEQLVLSYNQSFFTLEFAALNYSSPEMNRYAYQMEGFDDDWRHTGADRRFATYTNLDPGEYRFRVKASNNDGVWNETGLTLPIIITPPWWQTAWFRILATILVIGAIAGAFIGQRQNAIRREHVLETQVAERTHDLKAARDEAEAARAKAEIANQAKSTFLANMSHELRTPLNAILGFSSMIGRDHGTPLSVQEKVAIINRSGEHLLAMINDVLDLSKIEAGRVELELEVFELPAMLKDIGQMFELRAETAGLRFEQQIDPALARFIKADAGKLRQILINLLGNAVKFTQEGGVALRVRTKSMPEDPDMVSLQLEVEDTGPGIVPEQLQRIFEPFVQAGRSPSSVKGTGLGLAISKSFVELMGGQIGVESAPGQGAMFHVKMPVALAAAVSQAEDRVNRPLVSGLESGQPGWRVLVVEDNPENRLLLSSLLREVGFKVREAENGEKAIEVYSEWHPHIIWMDIRMPVLDGFEATRRIRQLPGGDVVKIIALTASAFKEQRQDIREAGCDEVMHKPFQTSEILDAMAKQLGVRYRYEEIRETPAETVQELNPAAIAKLPDELLQPLRRAALILNDEDFITALEPLREQDPDLAGSLEALVQDFRFDLIQELLVKEVGDRE